MSDWYAAEEEREDSLGFESGYVSKAPRSQIKITPEGWKRLYAKWAAQAWRSHAELVERMENDAEPDRWLPLIEQARKTAQGYERMANE